MPGKIIFDLIGFSQPEKCKNDSQREGDGRPFSAEALFDIDPEHDIPVSTDYNSNLDFCKKLKGKNADFLIREFTLADGRRSFPTGEGPLSCWWTECVPSRALRKT